MQSTEPRRQFPKDFLRWILFGSPLSKRQADAVDPSTSELNSLLSDVVSMLEREHGRTVSFRQTERELENIKSYPLTSDASVSCKRAMLLFALWKEPEFAAKFTESDGALVEDLTKRVLPLIAPAFVENLGQRPDSFVCLCSTLCVLYTDERISGNRFDVSLPLPLPFPLFN